MVTDEGPILNAFTVDLEDWFQGLTSTNPQIERWPTLESRVEPMTERLLAILGAHDIQATFFVLGYIADRHPALLAAIEADGHEIAVHGYWHTYVTKLTRDEFAQELEQAVAAISSRVGQRPIGHRAPYFSVNQTTPWVFDVLQEQGFLYDSSIFPIRNGYYGYSGAPRFPYVASEQGVVEFPLSTLRIGGVNWPIAGGFYVRMLPHWFISRAIRRLNRRQQPAILYMHPWELDLEQPMHAATPRERITHYGGRRSLASKLDRLFSEFRFGPLRALLEQQPQAGQATAVVR